MTTYNAKDLIEQAQMLADIQNSDFISWKENMMFLDNAWSDLYQQIINHGDKAFIKSFTFSGERVELPCDFYQVYYVSYFDGQNKIPINRKAKTCVSGGPYYDIVGDELVIFNRMNSYRNIEVEYFPVRDSITFASDDRTVERIEGTVLDVCDKYALYSTGSGQQTVYLIRDVINGTVKEADEGFMLTENGVVNDTIHPIFKMDNRRYLTAWDNGTLYIYKGGGQTPIHTVEVEEAPSFPTRQINAMTNSALFYSKNGKLFRFDLETGKEEELRDDLIDTKVYSFKGNIYYETRDGVYCNCNLLVPTTEYDTFNGVMKEDEKTGYGMLFNNSVIKSVYENTELLFPNNVYYNFLAYKLAVYYKMKAGSDASGVIAMANDALNTFYNTLLRDTNEYVRISNVYAR